MQGYTVFHSIPEALAAGYQVFDKTAEGYLVRTQTARGWALARVIVKEA